MRIAIFPKQCWLPPHRWEIEVLSQTPPLELQPAVIEHSAHRNREAIETLPVESRSGSVSLAIIARGSSTTVRPRPWKDSLSYAVK